MKPKVGQLMKNSSLQEVFFKGAKSQETIGVKCNTIFVVVKNMQHTSHDFWLFYSPKYGFINEGFHAPYYDGVDDILDDDDA